MNREKFENALEMAGEFLGAAMIFAIPFVGFWLKYIFFG